MENLRDLANRVGNMTLEEFLKASESLSADVKPVVSHGKTLMRRTSDVSCSDYLVLGAVLSYHKQATEARSALQFWTATNGYARSLTIRQVFMTLTYGAARLMDLIKAEHMML